MEDMESGIFAFLIKHCMDRLRAKKNSQFVSSCHTQDQNEKATVSDCDYSQLQLYRAIPHSNSLFHILQVCMELPE